MFQAQLIENRKLFSFKVFVKFFGFFGSRCQLKNLLRYFMFTVCVSVKFSFLDQLDPTPLWAEGKAEEVVASSLTDTDVFDG